jgi:hypothetical protein
MTIDISKIRPGDEVTVRATVQPVTSLSVRFTDGDFLVRIPHQPGAAYPGTLTETPVLAEAIVSHTPKALQPGDRVRCRTDGDREYEVVAGPRTRADGVCEYAIWRSDDGFSYARAERLERVQ